LINTSIHPINKSKRISIHVNNPERRVLVIVSLPNGTTTKPMALVIVSITVDVRVMRIAMIPKMLVRLNAVNMLVSSRFIGIPSFTV
uniref:MSP domain-containing protein n=1 Tax=Anisakis simplex TaxID=6269 RepID=A0A0M3JBY1_ANISI